MSTSESFTHIYSTLASGQLKPAISMLISKADEMRDSEMKERILTMNETYTYLLQYLASGTSDPQRKSVYNSIRNSLYECADSLFERQKSIESHNFVYTQKQYLRDEISRSGMSLQNLINRLKVREELNTQEEKREHENTAVRMFNHIWLMGADTDMLADLFNDESIPMTDKCLAISALTIHLLRKFDIDEAMLLTSLCEYDDDDVAERALVGLLPIMTKYNDRLTSQARWRNRIEAMMDLDGMKNAVKRIITQYMRTNETEELVKELNDEILPEMKKLSKDIENADIRSIISEDGEDVNPQWQDKLDKSGLTEKLKRFSDLQMEGSDVYMSTFAMLKSCPFFLYVAN